MEKSDIYTGTIVYMDSQMKAGYITRDADGARVYFDFSDVIRDVGLGTARENHMVQFVQAQDANGKLVAKYVTVMPSRRAAK